MVGIVGYGCYIPKYRIKVEEIAKVWKKDALAIKNGLMINEKSVSDIDEDTITLSVEAGRNALISCGIEPEKIGALFIGSESHPYVVKPSGTVVSESLQITPEVIVADFEFACKAGTAAMLCCSGLVKSGYIKYGMGIGSDTAQSKPGDALEFTAASGAGAFIIGNNPAADIEGFYSYTTDTPDFWRREGQEFPKHGARFTGEPAYYKHVVNASKALMERLSLKPSDFDYVVLHMPNGKFPTRAAKKLGFQKEQYEKGLIVTRIGNTYSASSLIGLCAVLDDAKPGDRILLTSFGSGAGSDSFSFVVTDKILELKRGFFEKYAETKKYIDYGTYVRLRKKLR